MDDEIDLEERCKELEGLLRQSRDMLVFIVKDYKGPLPRVGLDLLFEDIGEVIGYVGEDG